MIKNRVNEFLKNPHRALFIIAGPMIIGFLAQTLYNVVDTAFVGRIGPEAIAALTYGFPIFFILMGLNVGLGSGVNSKISRYLGAKKKALAENAAMHGLVFTMALALLLFILGIIFLKPLFSIFGATGITAVYAYDYMYIILFAVFFMYPSFIFHNIFTAQGDAKTATIIQVCGVVANIILDPIFIYVFGMGVKGAAVATLLSFLISLILYLVIGRKRSHLEISFKKFKYDKEILKDILRVGFPASIMMQLMSISLIVFNRIMSGFGTNHVAMLGISFRLNSVAIMPLVALSLALLTIVGMFKGAKRYEKVIEIIRYATKIGFIISFSIGAILFAIPHLALKIFTNDPALIALGIPYIRIDLLGLPFAGVAVMISRAIQGLGYGSPSLVINSIRMVGISIPFALIAIYVFNLSYLFVAASFAFGSVVSCIVGFAYVRHYEKGFELNKKID